MLSGTDNPKLRPDYRSKTIDREKLQVGPRADWHRLIEENLRFCGYDSGCELPDLMND
jgi:hypothetical protein